MSLKYIGTHIEITELTDVKPIKKKFTANDPQQRNLLIHVVKQLERDPDYKERMHGLEKELQFTLKKTVLLGMPDSEPCDPVPMTFSQQHLAEYLFQDINESLEKLSPLPEGRQEIIHSAKYTKLYLYAENERWSVVIYSVSEDKFLFRSRPIERNSNNNIFHIIKEYVLLNDYLE